MRYPPKAYKKDFESVEVRFSLSLSVLVAPSLQDRREREQQDLELAKEMTEDDEEEDFP